MSESEEDALDLFQEPQGWNPPEKEPSFAEHVLHSGDKLTLRLVGHNPLWGHILWNAGRTVSDYLEEKSKELVEGKCILELGAGAGLPSLVCALRGASTVVVTDYPDPDLIANLDHNINSCIELRHDLPLFAEGHVWGAPVDRLIAHLPQDKRRFGFDTLILADLLFNHSEHYKLIKTVQQTLSHEDRSCALVFFTPYRPWLLEKDLSFFEKAEEGGFRVEKILEKVMDKVLFEEDPGDELLRRTVYGYQLTWN